MEHVVYGFVTPTTLARIGAPSTLDQLQIVTRDRSLDRATVRRVALAVRDVAQARGHEVRAIDVPEPGRHIHAAQMDSLLYTMGAFGLLALLLSGFLVVNLVSAMLAGQLRDIGVMKAIGARPDQLARMYLGLALVLGLAASVMAIPLAAWIGRGYAGFSAQLLNFDIAGYVIPRWAFAVQLAAGMLLPVLAAAMPVVRGTRISVGTALRDVGIGGGATPAWLERVRGVGRPFLLSLRNAFRRRQRMALTLLTLAVGGAVFLGALDLRASIRRSVRVLYGEQMRFDMVVRLDEPHAVDSLEASASRIDGVTRAEAWAGARAALGGVDDLGESFPVTALPADSRLVAFPVKGGRWLLTTDSAAIVVNARLLEQQPSLVTGHDAIVLVAGRPMRWRVVGVVESGPTPAAYVTRGTLARATGDWRAVSVVIATEEQRVAQQSELIQRVRDGLEADGFAVAASQLMEASRRVIEDHLLMVAGFLVVMAQLTIIIGGLGLASTMSLAVLERTREIGVLRAIGASPRAILTIVQGEGMVVALLSWAIAIPLSLPVSLLLGQSFGRIMFPVPADPLPELSAVAIWLGVTVLVSVAACAWPASRAIRIPTSAALAYE
jgi:putative ABC transport system permease protein